MTLRLSGGRRLQSPPGERTRPTASRVRLAVMNVLADRLPGCRWLDLCSGSGVMACEALERGARQVVAIEQDRRIAAVARANLSLMDQAMPSGQGTARRWELHCSEACRWLNRAERGDGFDIVYVDPPYAAGLYEPLAEALLARGWMRSGGIMLWECSSRSVPGLPAGWEELDQRRYGSTSVVVLKPSGAPNDPEPGLDG